MTAGLRVCAAIFVLLPALSRPGSAVPGHPGKVEATFPDVAPGDYAVQVWHDENADGEIGRDLLGI